MEETKDNGKPMEKEDCQESQPADKQDEMWDLSLYPFAERAFELAREGLAAGEVPVGCVFAYFPDDVSAQEKPLQPVIIAESYNSPNKTRNPTCHAEINAIDRAIEWAKENDVPLSSLWPRTSAIVTVEPCVMCASALLSLGFRHVRYGCKNDRFGGCGSILDVAAVFGPEPDDSGHVKESTKFVGGWRSEESMKLLKEFYMGENPNAPPDKVKRKKRTKNSDVTSDA